jgi:hypothetical protein
MRSDGSESSQAEFCTACGTRLLADSRFCHSCGTPTRGRPPAEPVRTRSSAALRWGLSLGAFAALIALAAVQVSREAKDDPEGTLLAAAGVMGAPDIRSMSPEERADRLFNRVMSLSSQGKMDSAAFFTPMAIAAFEALGPLTAHGRYDLGLIALTVGDAARAAAQADTILAQRPTHLMGLVLGMRAADARGDAAASRSFRQRLLAAEESEFASALPEYDDHSADLRAAIAEARAR